MGQGHRNSGANRAFFFLLVADHACLHQLVQRPGRRFPCEARWSRRWTAPTRASRPRRRRPRQPGLLGLGVGGVKREVDFSRHPELNSSRTSSGLAFALAGGVDYDINDAWLAGAELRYNIISTSEGEIGAGHVSTLDLLFKCGYKF